MGKAEEWLGRKREEGSVISGQSDRWEEKKGKE